MTLDRDSASSSVIDVLDHVLDKGIVIDAWARVSVVGIDLITVEARVVVASIGTYLSYADVVSQFEPVWRAPDVIDLRRARSLQAQLDRVREQLRQRRLEPLLNRRAEDRVRDERHDRRAKTITRKRH